MSFAWFVARRYLTARRRQAFISVISAVSILGVGVGVMALIIALALMTGVQTELRDRIVGSTAHVFISKDDPNPPPLDADPAHWRRPGVRGASPMIVGFGLLTASGQTPKAVTIKGIDPRTEPDVTDIGRSLSNGALQAVARAGDRLDGVLLGAELARELGVTTGDTVDVFTSNLTPTLVGVIPRTRPLTVVGTFSFGFYEIDDSYALVSLETAADLLGIDGPDMMQLRLDDMAGAPAMRERLQQELGTAYRVQDWTQLNQPLYSALLLEKIAISLTIGLIVMVAALNIVASLVLLVMEKTRDIAILRTMGTPAAVIRRIFVLQGLTIGLIGTLAGTACGLVVCLVADRYRLVKLPPDVYQITYLPFRVLPMDVLVVVLSAVGVCLLATLYPSRQAGRIDPAEALRNQ
ncbi:MAG: ABC transporter permease [Acidobacteria bacterium]|nr:ABC transporter permease [Acidobacteriota bacterium]